MSAPSRGVLARIAGKLHRLVHPGYLEERERFQALGQRIEKLSTAQRKQILDLRTALAQVSDEISRTATHREIRDADKSIARL